MAIITVTTIADSGAGSLRAAIASAQSGDTITFGSNLSNQKITLTSGQLSISVGKNLTIDGSAAPGLSISGNQTSRIFLLNSTSANPTSLTLKNLALVDGYTNERGAAVSTTHQGVLTVENVTFTNNKADKGGGAIYSAFEGTVTVTGSRFVGNIAVAGNDERGAGAIAFHGPRNLTVRTSEFINNKGINGGAINSLNGKLLIDRCRFIGNDTTAAFYDTGKTNPSLRGHGGAVFTDRASSATGSGGTIQILNSTFEGNKGRSSGGAVHLYTGTQDSVSIVGSSFNNNEVLTLDGSGGQGRGGALVSMTNGLNQGLTITGSSFTNNKAPGQGGAMWMMGAATTITNSTFSTNRVTGLASNNVGGAMSLYGPTTLVNTTVAYNYAGWVGGGIAASSDYTVSVQNTIFYNNTADNGNNDWNIQQHTSRELTDKGGNIQWPPKQSNLSNSYNATAQVILVDPKLGSLQDNGAGFLTHALLTGSPAINAGVTSGAPTTDQRGYTRDTAPDIGALEAGAQPPTGGGSNPPIATDGNDNLIGTLNADLISGGFGNDTIVGNAGDDTLNGNAGSDTLRGGLGNDRLLGGDGSDVIIGGVGQDILTGGKAADRFVYGSFRDQGDVIRDFDVARDKIDLSQIITGSNFSSSQPFSAYVKLTQVGTRTVVSIDPNGDPDPDTFKPLVSLNNVSVSSLQVTNFIL